jgi:hypothetical protein
MSPVILGLSAQYSVFSAQLMKRLRLLSNRDAFVTPSQNANCELSTENSSTSPAPRIRTVAHFIAAPAGGGAEAMLRNLVAAMNREHWRTVVIVMD